jgi:hypothetical protein
MICSKKSNKACTKRLKNGTHVQFMRMVLDELDCPELDMKRHQVLNDKESSGCSRVNADGECFVWVFFWGGRGMWWIQVYPTTAHLDRFDDQLGS